MTQTKASAGELLPYCGEELERLENLGSSYVRRTFGNDRSGRRTYRFNRLGFRGADLDPSATYRVFAFGESHAFGYFVEFEECWPSRFVDLWIRHRKADPGDVCYLSFAEAGASNASIARSVVSQCSAVRPDLVLVHFADLLRSEVILNGRTHRVGPWLLQEEAKLAAREAPEDGGLPETLMELIERGSSFFRFALGPNRSADPPLDATCLLENLRNILWVQHFCASEGIPLVATCEHIDALKSSVVREDPTLASLAARLDPTVLCDFGIWSVRGDVSDDPEHVGPGRHDRFARAMFDFYRRHAEDAPSSPADGDTVRSFYEKLPFNHFASAGEAARSLLANPVPEAYPDLHRLLREGGVRSVADCGCGTGWLSNALALHYDVEVTGVDFTLRALERAREVARHLGVESRTRFVEADLLELVCDECFDLVVSLGALHHTVDPHRAFARVGRLVGPGGYVYVGLYHQPGREPFLEHFRGVLERGGEEEAFAEFLRLHPGRRDDEHLRSWFRDQVRHPRETQHTLREVAPWLSDAGLELVSTSINHFQPFQDVESLFELEAGYEARSRHALRQKRFFPGFFTFLARRLRVE